jgi:hypothetical protein
LAQLFGKREPRFPLNPSFYFATLFLKAVFGATFWEKGTKVPLKPLLLFCRAFSKSGFWRNFFPKDWINFGATFSQKVV